MWRRHGFVWRRAAGCCMLACCGVGIVTASVGRAGERTRKQSLEARDVVEAVAALAVSDAAIDVACSTACGLDRLPASRAAILPLVPSEHRRVLEECGHGRLRVKRQEKDLDFLALIDEVADRPGCVAAVRDFFAGRPVDVAIGAGLSDDPYPIAFDWVVVLDPRSKTLFSFVLNCRD